MQERNISSGFTKLESEWASCEREHQFWRQNYTRFVGEEIFLNKYVVLDEGELIAYGANLGELLEEARSKGLDLSRLWIHFIIKS